MNKKEIVDIIRQEKLVAIVRLNESKWMEEVIENLVIGGIKVLEITSNSPYYLEEITKARLAFPNVLIGAGTITNASIAKNAIIAGAQFIVTPNTNQDIVKTAHRYGVPVLMGALSPTEISMAVSYGADIIKLFPAGSFGLDYFKHLQGPYRDVLFFSVGGIGLGNVQEWLAAGVAGVAVGSILVNPTNDKKSLDRIKHTSIEFIKLINSRDKNQQNTM